MRIALYDCEEKKHNTALMQISNYHKSKGDRVEWYFPLLHDVYDKIYCSSLFSFSDKSMVTDDMICGGTGFENISERLPLDIEEADLDYSIYPDCKTSYIWFSRGCIRNCEFCLVREKEGYIHSVTTKNLNPNGEYISVQDNNFFANPNWKEAWNWLFIWKQPVDFLGIDVRLINKEQCEALLMLKFHKQLKIAWDNPKENIDKKIKTLIQYIKPYKIMCYVLIGYWSTHEEDFYRIETLRDLGVDPFVMPYNKKDNYQKRFSRWVNHKAIFNSVAWEDYKKEV